MLLFFLAGFITNAQEKGAKIEFKAYTIDYGTINKGADGVRTFEFTNTGDEPLIVSNVKSSCGCTIPKKPKQPILPIADKIAKPKIKIFKSLHFKIKALIGINV